MATFTSNSPAETEALGRTIAESLKAGNIVALQGDLGAGKTQFVKGVATALGSVASVTSPTFTLVHEYRDGRLPLYHFDFFRLEDGQAARNLALDDYFFGDGVSIVEWANRFPDLIPAGALWVRFEIGKDDERRIEIG